MGLLLMRPLASPAAGRFHRLLTRPFQAWWLKELLCGTKTGLRPATLLPSCFAFYDALIAESRTAVGTLFPYLELIIYHFSAAATSNFKFRVSALDVTRFKRRPGANVRCLRERIQASHKMALSMQTTKPLFHRVVGAP